MSTSPISNVDPNIFESGNGMQTYAWGPVLWTFLHIMSFNYPVKPTVRQKIQYWDFLTKLRNVLPCRHCRENLQRNLVDTNISYKVFQSRKSFSMFIYNLHNTVNKQLDKPEWEHNYEYLRGSMECLRARCSGKKPTKPTKKEMGCTEPKVCPVGVQLNFTERSTTETKKKPTKDKGRVVFKFRENAKVLTKLQQMP